MKLNPDTEVMPLVGSKEGIAKFFLAHLNPGDPVLLTTPCYPAYVGISALMQADVIDVPLARANEYRPDLVAIPAAAADTAAPDHDQLPGQPHRRHRDARVLRRALAWARAHDMFVVSDIAYCDLPLDPTYTAHSFLQFDKNKERDRRVPLVLQELLDAGLARRLLRGQRRAIGRLAKIKANMDFGIFTAIQRGGRRPLTARRTTAPRSPPPTAAAATCSSRACASSASGADAARRHVRLAAHPQGLANSIDFTADLLNGPASSSRRARASAPGEGYVRVALCEEEDRIREACARLERAGVHLEMARA